MAKKKRSKPFIRKGQELKKSAGEKVIGGVATGGSAVGTLIGMNKLKEKIPEKFHKVVGAGVTGIGIGMDVFVDNNIVSSVAKGMIAAGSIDTAKEFIPKADKLMGFETAPTKKPISGTMGAVDWAGYQQDISENISNQFTSQEKNSNDQAIEELANQIDDLSDNGEDVFGEVLSEEQVEFKEGFEDAPLSELMDV